MKRNDCATHVGGLVAAGLLAFGLPIFVPDSTQAQDLEDLTIGYIDGSTSNTIMWVAEEWGLFEKHGLKIDWVAANGPQIISGLISGSLHVGTSAPSLVASMYKQGECIRVVSTGQFRAYNVLGSASLDTPNQAKGYPDALADLRGKKIGVTARGGSTEYIMLSLLEGAGLGPDDVELIAVGGVSTSVAALRGGAVDAILAYPPMRQQMEPAEYKDLYDGVTDETGPIADLVNSVQAVSCDYYEQNREQVMNYCRAIWDARDVMDDSANAEQIAAIIGSRAGLKESLWEEFWQEMKATFISPELPEDKWAAQGKWIDVATPIPPYADSVIEDCVARDPRTVN